LVEAEDRTGAGAGAEVEDGAGAGAGGVDAGEVEDLGGACGKDCD